MSKKNKLAKINPKINPTEQTEEIKSNPVKLTNRIQFSIFLGVLFVLLVAVYQKFIFGSYVFLFKDIGSDSYNYTYPLFSHYAEYLQKDGIPQWSFQHGLGQNLYPFWFGPIRVILWLLNGNNVAETMIYIQVLHLLFGGIFFYCFLRNLDRSFIAAALTSIFFVFSGYATLGGSWSPEVFPQEVLQFSVLLFATQYYLSKNKWYFFPLAIALIAIYQPFNLYFASITVLIHCLLFYHTSEGFSFQFYARKVSKLVLSGLVGIFISAFQSWSNVMQLLESPRVSGDFSYSDTLSSKGILGIEKGIHYATVLLRAFSSDMMGAAQDYKGWNNYMESPVLYCGLLSLLFLPQIFVELSTKSKKIIFGLLGAIFLIILFPYFRYALWLFTGDYYRTFGLLLVVLMLVSFSKSFDNLLSSQKLNILVLGITLISLIILLIIGKPVVQTAFEKTLFRNVLIFLVLQSGLVFLYLKTDFKKGAVVGILLLALIEVVSFSRNSVYERKIVEKSEVKSIGYNDATIKAIDYLKEKETGFYRIEKNYSSGLAEHQSFNDAHLQGYFGSRAYHSFNQVNYVNFLRNLELVKANDEYGTRWLEGVMYEPYLQRLVSMKYYLTKLPNVKAAYANAAIDSLAMFDDVKLLKINYAFPFGVAFDKYITNSDFNKLTSIQKRKILLTAVVTDESTAVSKLKRISSIESIADMDTMYIKDSYQEAIKNSLKNVSVVNNQVKGEIETDQPRMLFFSIPYDEGWRAFVNEIEVDVKKIDIGLSGIMLAKGKNRVHLVYETPNLTISLVISLIFVFIYVFWIFFDVKAKKTGSK